MTPISRLPALFASDRLQLLDFAPLIRGFLAQLANLTVANRRWHGNWILFTLIPLLDRQSVSI